MLALLLGCALPMDSGAFAQGKGVSDLQVASSTVRSDGGSYVVWDLALTNAGDALAGPVYVTVDAVLPELTAADQAVVAPEFQVTWNGAVYNVGPSSDVGVHQVLADSAVLTLAQDGLAAWGTTSFCVRVQGSDTQTPPTLGFSSTAP